MKKALVLIVFFCALPLFAASDIYLKLDGIKGESTSAGHKDWIEVSSFSWGAGRIGAVTNDGANQPKQVHLVIRHSNAIANLQKSQGLGKTWNEAYLDIHGRRYTLENVIITAVNAPSTAGGADMPTENLSLNFTKVEVEYSKESPSNTRPPGSAVAPSHLSAASMVNLNAPNASFSLGSAPEEVTIIAVRPQGGNNVLIIERGASPAFFRNCVAGRHLPQVTIQTRKAGGNPQEYIKLNLKEVVVTSVQLNADGSVSLGLKYGLADGSVRPFQIQ